MELQNTNDLFTLSIGDVVSKRNLYDLIQYSKVAESQYWTGMELKINNTPQQGINWIGEPHSCKGVIIKTRPGLYKEDGWSDAQKLTYHYSFKAKEGSISYKEKANQALLNQPQRLYPIMLFSEIKDSWKFEGVFSVSGIEDNYVVLSRRISTPAEFNFTQEGDEHQEGERNLLPI
jgi:putative restriction endonuclease